MERRHLAGQYNTQIAAALGVDEQTVREDLKRLREIWKERAQDEQQQRYRAAAELDDIKRRAIEAAEWDQMCERAVLFDEITGAPITDVPHETTPAKRSVYRDRKGSAQFRGNKAAALRVALEAVAERIKLLELGSKKPEGEDGGDDPLDRLTAAIKDSLDALKTDGV